jgi:hypothetical protein
LLAALAAAVLLLASCGKADTAAVTPVGGRVTTPLAGAVVYAYAEGDNLFGPARVISEPSAFDGSYSLNLPPGRYLVVVRKRRSGETTGPVNAGDLRGDPVPLTVRAGEPVTLDLSALIKDANEKSFPAPDRTGKTGISGVIRDEQGRPVSGVRVHVYDHIQMSERPKYVSEKTGPDGRYAVMLARGGTYYIAARDRFGGPPQVGDLYGRYDEGTVDPSGVVVRAGEIAAGVDLVVHKVW